MTPRRRVAIVGGGLAGLAAAENLARDDDRFDITVFERRRLTGGRAGSFERPGGSPADYCQHVAMGCCGELLELLRRSELLQFWQRSESLRFLHPDFPPSIFRPAKWLPPPLHLLPTIHAMRYFRVREKLRLILGIASLLRSSPETFIDQTAMQWLVKHRQGERLRRLFWEPILVSALGESMSKVSMAPARKTIVDGFAADRDASDVWVPQLPLSELFGDRLCQHLRNLGVHVQTGQAVDAVSTHNRSMQLTFAERNEQMFDFVVLAVPWFRLKSMLGDGLTDTVQQIDFIDRIAGSSITGIHLWFDRPILKVPHVVMLETTSQWLFASPIDGGDPNYVQVVVSASSGIENRENLLQTVCREIRQIDSSVASIGAAEAKLLDSKIVTDPRSVFSVTPETERCRPSTCTNHERLFLAGDYVATGWPSTMEGAVISGRMAADAVRNAAD